MERGEGGVPRQSYNRILSTFRNKPVGMPSKLLSMSASARIFAENVANGERRSRTFLLLSVDLGTKIRRE